MAFHGKTIWLVGASEGLGLALAKQLAAEGAQLILSARSEDRLQEIAKQLPNARALPLDVSDLSSIQHAYAQIKHLDGVIYNAGAYEPMSAQNWNTKSALNMVDVNLSGALRVIGCVLPDFLSQERGEITLIGSLSGYRGLPKAIGYGASKSALISLAETLRHDLKGTSVGVRLINPGFIRTRLTDKNTFKMPMLMEPEQAAQKICAALLRKRFRTDFPAPFSWAIRLYDLLPDGIVYRGK
ncbi:SDR family NAD(P)-dependent oxidoreductase [Epibacterium ulvae]|uniref:SDR family NAD(P)-dependent oxidoreductase n=1 Tax=Epibacterium ulvae TaxID=1156985 RepID=UPI002491B712|nr:SDR family NAD(P)-dependent oxidoreductase [Epibacterium ulvae]